MDLPSDFFFHFHFLNWQLRGGVFLFVTVVVAAFCIFLDFCTLHATMNTFFIFFLQPNNQQQQQHAEKYFTNGI
jgi:hypothetical protein